MKNNINFLDYDNKTMKLQYPVIYIKMMEVIEVDKNDDYLVGHPKEGTKSLKTIKSNQFQELYNLINLLDEKEFKKAIHTRKYENLEKIVPINKIKKFVEKYGIPATSNYQFKMINKKIGFSLRRLRYWVVNMYQAITLFFEIENYKKEKYELENNKDIKKEVKEKNIKRMKNKIFNSADKMATFSKSDSLPEIKEKLIKFIINDSLKINLVYDKESDQYNFVNSTSDMLGAAGFQFRTMLATGLADENNQLKHKRCEYCGNLFWAEDGKQIYCEDNCNNKAFYHREQKGKQMLKEGFSVDQVYKELKKKTRKSTIQGWKEKIDK